MRGSSSGLLTVERESSCTPHWQSPPPQYPPDTANTSPGVGGEERSRQRLQVRTLLFKTRHYLFARGTVDAPVGDVHRLVGVRKAVLLHQILIDALGAKSHLDLRQEPKEV